MRKQPDANSEIQYGDYTKDNGVVGKRTRPDDVESLTGANKNFGSFANDGRSEDGYGFQSIS